MDTAVASRQRGSASVAESIEQLNGLRRQSLHERPQSLLQDLCRAIELIQQCDLVIKLSAPVPPADRLDDPASAKAGEQCRSRLSRPSVRTSLWETTAAVNSSYSARVSEPPKLRTAYAAPDKTAMGLNSPWARTAARAASSSEASKPDTTRPPPADIEVWMATRRSHARLLTKHRGRC